MSRPRVALLWLETTAPGSAPGHHLLGTRQRLEAGGYAVSTERVIAEREPGPKLRRIAKLSLRSLRTALRADVLIARWHPALFPSVLFWRALRRRVVLLVQGPPGTAFVAHPILGRVPGIRTMYRINLRLASALAVPHVGIAESVARDANVPVSEIAILPNGHPEQQDLGESSLSSELPARYVLFAGALAHWQGVGVMLEATRSPAWPDGLTLLIIGDGADVGLVEAASGPRVRYLGRRSPAEVGEALRGAVCSLSPKVLTDVTSSGISPFKVLEAGTQSTAVVATRVPGQAEYVDQYACGLLIEPGDAEGLAHAVSKLHYDEDLAHELGRNGRAASRNFRWENHAAELSRLVEPRQSP